MYINTRECKIRVLSRKCVFFMHSLRFISILSCKGEHIWVIVAESSPMRHPKTPSEWRHPLELQTLQLPQYEMSLVDQSWRWCAKLSISHLKSACLSASRSFVDRLKLPQHKLSRMYIPSSLTVQHVWFREPAFACFVLHRVHSLLRSVVKV